MKQIGSAANWWKKTYSQQSKTGKTVFAGLSVIIFCCLCGLPLSFFSPSTSSPESVKPSVDAASVQTAAVNTLVAGINQTLTVSAPTANQEPTLTAPPDFTETPLFTITPPNTATITDTPQATLPAGVSSCIPSDTLRETAIVLGIVDGDTINVQLNGQIVPVRYIGIDAPETGKEYYGQAAQVNQNLVYSKTVTLIMDKSDRDSSGNLLRYVLVDNIFVNLEIIKQGYALAVAVSPDTACSTTLTNAQGQAQSAAAGVWVPTLAPYVPPASGGNSTGSDGGGGFDNNGDGKVTCADFATQAAAQQAYNAGYTNLDGNDNDGLACESLP